MWIWQSQLPGGGSGTGGRGLRSQSGNRSLGASVDRDIPRSPLAQPLHADEIGHRPGFSLLGSNIEPVLHTGDGALAPLSFFEFLSDEWILFIVRNGVATVADVNRAQVFFLFAGAAGPASARVIGPKPSRHTQWLFSNAKVLVKPVAAHRRGTHHTNRLVVDAEDLIGFAVGEWVGAQLRRPRVGVALAFEANQDRRGAVLVCLGVAARLMFPDPHVKTIVGHYAAQCAGSPAIAGY